MNHRIRVRIATALNKRNRKKNDTKAVMMCVVMMKINETKIAKKSNFFVEKEF